MMATLNISSSQTLLAASTVGIGLSIYILVTFASTVFYNLYFHPLAKFPGPPWRAASNFWDCWSMLTGDALTDTQKLHERYGAVVRIMPNALSFNTAQAWKDIYGTRLGKGQLPKDPIVFQRGDAANIVSANDTDHARIRKLLSHAFSEAALREQEPILTTYFELLVSRLKDQINGPAAGKVDIISWYTFTTFDIIGSLRIMLTEAAETWLLESPSTHSKVVNITNMFQSVKFLGIMRFAATYPIINRIFKILMSSIPSMADKRKSHFAYTRKKTESRLDRQTDRKDFTAYILRYNDERGMTREEIISNAGTLLVAGSETTATLLSGATFHLLANPRMLEKVQAEVRSAFKSESEITLLSVGNPSRLSYMEAVLTESLRVYPPVPAALPRMTGPAGEVIDGNFIPPNTSVGVHQWATHQSSSNFTDPQSFLPERWLVDVPERYSNDNKAALQPFSMGPRNCLGRNLAYFEMRSILARMLWHFDIALCEESTSWPHHKAYLLWDKPPLWVTLKHRTIN